MRSIVRFSRGSLFLAVNLVIGLAIPAGAIAAAPQGSAVGVVAQGQVLAYGLPVKGARVQLWAWDPGRALMKLHPGQRGDARMVGSALTGLAGRYAIRIAAPATLAAQAEPDGTVNLTAVAQSRQGVSTWSFAHRRYRTKFVEREYGFSCSHGILTYQTRTTGYAGGAISDSWPAPPAHRCVTQEAHSRFVKDTTAAYTWSAGFSIPVLDTSLTAQTGYDHSAEITYYFRVKRALCGTNALPGGPAKLIVAGNPSEAVSGHRLPAGHRLADGLPPGGVL